MIRRENPPTRREAWDATAARLRLAREALGLRQTDLAKGIGVTDPKQSKYENAIEKIPFEYMWRLENWYGVTASYLITGSTAGLPPELKRRLKESG